MRVLSLFCFASKLRAPSLPPTPTPTFRIMAVSAATSSMRAHVSSSSFCGPYALNATYLAKATQTGAVTEKIRIQSESNKHRIEENAF